MPPILRGSNLMQIYDNLDETPLKKVHEVWAGNIMTPVNSNAIGSFAQWLTTFALQKEALYKSLGFLMTNGWW